MTVIVTCKQCGAVNRAEAGTCCFCDARLSQNTKDSSVSAAARPVTEGNLAVAPDWRSEVTSRLKAYRARHKREAEDPSQPELVFEDAREEAPASETGASIDPIESHAGGDAPVNSTQRQAPTEAPAARWRHTRLPRPETATDRSASAPVARAGTETSKHEPPAADRSSLDRVVIDVRQPVFDFQNGPRGGNDRWDTGHSAAERPWRESLESRIYPVAALAERRRAGALDAALLLFSYGAFLSLFVALGGRFAFSKVDAAIAGSTLALFYALYVALFTFFGGTTPGMMLRHLRVVSFDGSDPTPGQLLWRSFGYLVSAGTFLFGFLAALWDDDSLCWHDRISQTYLTSSQDANPR